jgi:hypothetical protein
LNSAGFAVVREYLEIRGASTDDPLLSDARKHACA